MKLLGKLIKAYWIVLAILYTTEFLEPTKFMSTLLCVLAALLINTGEQERADEN